MKKLKHTRPLAAILILVLTALTGCAMRKLPDVSVKNISQYRSYQEQKGVKVAVDPYFEEERLFEFFGDDILLSYGLLPVHVIVENEAKEPLLVQKENIMLITSENNAITQEPLAYAKMPMAQKMRQADMAMSIAPILIVVPAVGKAPAVCETIMLNIDAKAIYDKVIYRGEQHYGFVYFLLKDNIPKDAVPKVRVKAKTLATDETYTFTFDMDLNAIKRKTKQRR